MMHVVRANVKTSTNLCLISSVDAQDFQTLSGVESPGGCVTGKSSGAVAIHEIAYSPIIKPMIQLT